MSASIMDGTRYLYAEQLKGRSVTLTIKAITGDVEFTDTRGKKNIGYDVEFAETKKVLGVGDQGKDRGSVTWKAKRKTMRTAAGCVKRCFRTATAS
jgi:hypothetical protein